MRIGFQKPVLAIVMAGGRGKRLGPLTQYRCKPEMPFATNRLIDFALANAINSQIINHVMILTQYMQQGLITHLSTHDGLISHGWGKMVNVVPAQQQHDDDSWYNGTANAVYQNRQMIRNDPAEIVVILAADHIYKLDIQQMRTFHLEQNADFTVCGLTMTPEEAAGNFGVMELDDGAHIVGFEEKPAAPKTLPDNPERCFASMGIYMVNKKFLLDVLDEDHVQEDSEHDFGKNIIPRIIAKQGAMYGYDYNENDITGEMHGDALVAPTRYWRDVGRIGSYWEAVMDLTEVVPMINLYNKNWPIPTGWDGLPPAKFVNPDKQLMRHLMDTLAAGGCIVDDNTSLKQVVLSRNVRIQKHVVLERVVVFDNVTIGPRVHIKNAIVEEDTHIPPDVRIGYDLDEDIRNGVFIDTEHDPKSWYPPIRVVTKDSFTK